MNAFRIILLATVCTLWIALPADVRGASRDEPETARFVPLHVYLDSGDAPLAAYQLDLAADPESGVAIVGIEGGDHAAYHEPPYYDPAAMRQERVIIADFSTLPNEQLPTGRTRIATIHLMTTGDDDPAFETHLVASATTDGTRIHVTVQTTLGNDS